MAEWVQFREAGRSDTGRTLLFDVVAKADAFPLGTIRWFGRWHQYAFFPFGNTVFEKTCLRDIAAFCEEQTRLHRSERAGIRRVV